MWHGLQGYPAPPTPPMHQHRLALTARRRGSAPLGQSRTCSRCCPRLPGPQQLLPACTDHNHIGRHSGCRAGRSGGSGGQDGTGGGGSSSGLFAVSAGVGRPAARPGAHERHDQKHRGAREAHSWGRGHSVTAHNQPPEAENKDVCERPRLGGGPQAVRELPLTCRVPAATAAVVRTGSFAKVASVCSQCSASCV